MQRRIKTALLSTLLSLFALQSYANTKHTLQLYQSPKKQAKAIAKIKPGDKLIPIITQDDQWLKVAKAKDGTVGWVKRSELEHFVPPQPKLYHLTITDNGDQQGKQTIHYTGTEKLSKDEVKQLYQSFFQQHIKMTQHMNQMIQQMNQEMRALESMFNEPLVSFQQPGPVIEPIVIQPEATQVKQEKQSWWQQLKERLKF